ncbi:MAG: gamma carbonic anhydrase family protein [Magnetovibrio sp.]|nr:gamma carbonic anhydrase family protein [Magnetovibrio sp.]
MTDNILTIRGKTPVIADDVFIASTAVVIGDVEIGAGSGIWYHCVVRGDINEIRIGENTNIQDGSVIHVDRFTYGTFIGNNITVGHMCLIHACRLEDNCMVGMQATVMDGAVVESGALVAAGALVPPGKRVPSGQVWGGSPAKYLCDVKDAHQQMMDRIWPGYRELAQEFRAAGLDLRDMGGPGAIAEAGE